MKTKYKVLIGAGGLLAIWYLFENTERWSIWKQVRAYADFVGKPLLMVGMQRQPWQPPNGDVTLDIDPLVETIPGGILADERNIPFPDKYFGACYNAHTLEHMFTINDCDAAVQECVRVADRTAFICPSPYSPSNLFSISHHLRLWFDPAENKIRVVDNNWRNWRTGIGLSGGGQYESSIGQHMIVEEAPGLC